MLENKYWSYNDVINMEFWIEKGWGDSVENVTILDIYKVIEEIIKIDEEHGFFWIGYTDEEYVLKISKDLSLVFIYGKNLDKQLRVELNNWEEVKHFIWLYFSKDFLTLQNEIKLISFSNI